MAWIESHQALGHHPKTIRLAALLKVRVPEAVGLLQFLWWWALDYAPDGWIAVADQPVVARACLWHGPTARFWEALQEVGFVEPAAEPGTCKIHDWMDYAGRLVERRAANAVRMKAKRAAHVQRTFETRAGATVPDRTQPDTTVPDHPPGDPPTTENARFTCCALADVTGGKDHMQSCPTMAAAAS